MSKALITEGYLTDIANAIRAKNGSADTYTPPQMAGAIADIPTGSDVDVEPLSVTQNGTYTAPSGKAYSPVTALVPNTYASGDEGKVVQNGALVAQTSRTLTQNGTYDTTTNDSVTVNVSGGGGTSLQFNLGRLTVNTGEIAESSEYCYSDLIPINQGPGRWFLDLARSDLESYYIGISFFDQDGETNVGYIRQYESYRSYQNTTGRNAKYFRIANKVSNLSFASAAFLGDGIYVAPQSGTIYQINPA